ncbi:hypothetical protein KFE25_007179 [Diacronema lutheri]|uniref:Thymidylate synthase n=2 Tax=Diacronema lutheri TaxID=2081491 RepID=A0A8J6CAY0_DIALT|nr:hypothetical protein KFE25_007179 [Diacronema lutheri]
MRATPGVPGLPRYATPREMLDAMEAATRELPPDGCLRNWIGVVEQMDASAIVVETDLFPADALAFYTFHNLAGAVAAPPELLPRMDELRAQYYAAARGGGQGDYRAGIAAKVADVVACLQAHPGSKRAVLSIPFSSGRGSHEVRHGDTDEAKCLRELHFYIDAGDDRLHCSAFMRAQATSIFPKNIHLIGTLLGAIAQQLGLAPGTYVHFVTTLVHGR